MSRDDIMPQQEGSTPNYLLNIDEMGNVIEDKLKESLNCVRSGIQRSKGFLILSESWGVEVATWEVPFDIELTGLTFAQEEVRNMGYDDYINIYVDDEMIVETMYLKEVQEKKSFRNMMKVSEGSIIKIEYINGTDIPKEFKIDLEYINKTPMPIVESPEPETPVLLPIYRIYMRYEGDVATDLDIYANLFNNRDGSDITPSRTIGFSRRAWGIDVENIAKVVRVSDNHSGFNDREDEPEVVEIYGKPSSFFRFYATNYKHGDRLEEEVTMEIFKVDANGNDGQLLHSMIKQPSLFHDDNAKVYFFDFELESESIVEL